MSASRGSEMITPGAIRPHSSSARAICVEQKQGGANLPTAAKTPGGQTLCGFRRASVVRAAIASHDARRTIPSRVISASGIGFSEQRFYQRKTAMPC
jgi:hypothetical protein